MLFMVVDFELLSFIKFHFCFHLTKLVRKGSWSSFNAFSPFSDFWRNAHQSRVLWILCNKITNICLNLNSFLVYYKYALLMTERMMESPMTGGWHSFLCHFKAEWLEICYECVLLYVKMQCSKMCGYVKDHYCTSRSKARNWLETACPIHYIICCRTFE